MSMRDPCTGCGDVDPPVALCEACVLAARAKDQTELASLRREMVELKKYTESRDQQVRERISERDTARAENVRLTARVEEVLAVSRQRIAERDALRAENVRLTARVAELTADVREAEKTLDTNLRAARAEAERITGLLACAHADLDAARAEVESLKAQLAERCSTLLGWIAKTGEATERAESAEEQLRVAREALEKLIEAASALMRSGYAEKEKWVLQAAIDDARALSASTPKVAESCSAYYARGEKCPCEVLAMHPPKEPTKAEPSPGPPDSPRDPDCEECHGTGDRGIGTQYERCPCSPKAEPLNGKCEVCGGILGGHTVKNCAGSYGGPAALDALKSEQQRQVLATDAKLVDACPKPCRADLMRVAEAAWTKGRLHNSMSSELSGESKAQRAVDCAAIVSEVSR